VLAGVLRFNHAGPARIKEQMQCPLWATSCAWRDWSLSSPHSKPPIFAGALTLWFWPGCEPLRDKDK
jgi:hypothetical protein